MALWLPFHESQRCVSARIVCICMSLLLCCAASLILCVCAHLLICMPPSLVFQLSPCIVCMYLCVFVYGNSQLGAQSGDGMRAALLCHISVMCEMARKVKAGN